MEANTTPSKQKLFEQEQSDCDTPTTPKKKPQFTKRDPPTTRKIKSFTQIKQKQSASPIYFLLVFIWGIIMIGIVLFAFQNKLNHAQSEAILQISQCKIDYQLNRCASPVKKMVDYCNAKMNCMNEQAFQKANKSVSYSRLLGEVMYEFTQGLGLVGLVIGFCLIGMCVKQKGHTKQTVTIEFFQDS